MYLHFAAFCFVHVLLFTRTESLVTETFNQDPIKISIETSRSQYVVDKNFVSFAFGDSAIKRHWKQIDLRSQKIQELARALSPSFLRQGGTESSFFLFDPNAEHQDSYFLETYEDDTQEKTYTNYTVTGEEWDLLNKFSSAVDFSLLFDFNVLLRTPNDQWDPSNAKLLLDYSSKRGYKLHFELGNEPNSMHHAVGRGVDPLQLGSDFKLLYKILKSHPFYNNSLLVGPDTTRPRKPSVLDYMEKFLSVAADVLDVVTWHHYYFDGKDCSVSDFLDVDLMNLLATYISDMRRVVDKYKPGAVMWLGETADAWGGGAKNLSDRYLAGFMWLDKLGLSAAKGISMVIKNTLQGGAYGAIRMDGTPAPHLVGETVLNVTCASNVSVTCQRQVRVYAHCTRTLSIYEKGSVTLIAINLQEDQAAVINVPERSIDQYLLSPYGSDGITSREIALNGKVLRWKFGQLPSFPPKKLSPGSSISLPPLTYGFFVLPKANAKACT
ncbi:heparanase isoform X2 [Lingula anatina]|uniref:Heparanase isoform X2 n=1 Tax=Lingula anatina TaxID=7574 RepID=A0A1S3HAT6_LINAN|nr:heparanase isoform X2 [Lingula anatina]|eukprot:XP_013383152.1 heparanase isoform X2 [Lingula anatina]